MKITQAELKQIIKEEVERYRQIKLLENKKQAILRQLDEMKVCQECGKAYEESMEEGSDKMVDEILGSLFGKKDPAEKKAAMKTFILKHPTYKNVPGDIAEKFKKDKAHILDKLVDFFTKEGTLTDNDTKLAGVKAFVFDPKSDSFVNRTKTSVPYGPSSSTGEL